jgi:CDP-diacylglycerol--serine O-phosphatidyltransferase
MKNLRYLVPSSITAMALTCGVLAILHGIDGDPVEGSWWVLYATILDRMDGIAARALKASSKFGVWLDSTSDFVAFGVAPAFLFMGTSPDGFQPILLLPMAVYILGAGIRLVRFSLSEEVKKEFDGVPSTLAGGVYAVGLNVALIHGLSGAEHLWLFGAVLIAFGIAMNTPWIHYGKVGGLSTPWLNYFGVATVLACTVFILMRTLPEFVFGASGLIMLTAPLISRKERREEHM